MGAKGVVEDYRQLREIEKGVPLIDTESKRTSGIIAFTWEDLAPNRSYQTLRGSSVVRSPCGSVTLNSSLPLLDPSPLGLSGPPPDPDPSPLSSSSSSSSSSSVGEVEWGEEGQYVYLESHEYLMYNTYDVHFYASFALIQTFPRLELNLQREIGRETLMHRPHDLMTTLADGKRVARKVRGAVPHDVGTPSGDPFLQPNAYCVHDVSHWKDLNSKFVLQVYRDFVATGDRSFLRDMWPVVFETMLYLDVFDRDRDGMIENENFPDQTYDTWDALGVSAYCGGLWVAALSAASSMAALLDLPLDQAHFASQRERASRVLENLWNGSFYDYDSSGKKTDTLMADALAGQWYARACGLASLHPAERVKGTLRQIFLHNVMGCHGGHMGAANGFRPSRSTVDTSSMQSCEVWTGTTYGLAACMMQEGLTKEAWRTLKGMYRATYVDHAYFFQTPEALDMGGRYRAPSYMRPLSIWAVQWALDHPLPLDAPSPPSSSSSE